MDGQMLSPKKAVPVVAVEFSFFPFNAVAIALFLSQSSFRILTFLNKTWQRFSTGIDFHQEKPD